MIPVLLEIGSFQVHGYAVMLVAAFMVGNWVLSRELHRQGIDPTLGPTITMLALVFGVAGAKGLWMLQHWPKVLDAPVAMILGGGGMTWYGGLAAATAAVAAYLRWQRMPLATVLDASAPALMLAYGIGRLGCHLAGDGDYGLPTSLPWGTDYSGGLVPPSRALAIFPEIAARYPGGLVPDTTPLHPTPVYEFLLAVAGFALLRALRQRRWPPGKLFLACLALAGSFRFAVEFLRVNRRIAFGLSEAQLMSAALVIAGMSGIAYLGRQDRLPVLVAGRELMGRALMGRSVALAIVGWAFLWSQVGCVATGDLSGLGDTQFRTSTTELTGVRFEPGFLRDPTWQLPPSRGNLWLASTDTDLMVTWAHLLVTADIGQGPKDCDLCVAQVIRQQHGMEICADPEPNRYIAFMELKELSALSDEGRRSVPTDLQTPQGLYWQRACLPAVTGATAPVSFTARRSAQWAVVTLETFDPGVQSFALTLPKPPLIGIGPTVGIPTANIRIVPAGPSGRLLMVRKLDRYLDICDPPAQPGCMPRAFNWKWRVTPTDEDGTRWWSDTFSPTLMVGRVRVFPGKLVTDADCPTGCVQQARDPVVPRRIRVYQSNPDSCPADLSCDLFYCSADAAAPDGNIDFGNCRSAGSPSHPTTPAYIVDEKPARPDPLTWVVEFGISFPNPTLAAGEDLIIEFELRNGP